MEDRAIRKASDPGAHEGDPPRDAAPAASLARRRARAHHPDLRARVHVYVPHDADDLERDRLGVPRLESSVPIDADVGWDFDGGAEPTQTWFTLGFNFGLSTNTNLRLFWQMSEMDGDGFAPFLFRDSFDAKGGLIGTQLSVKF